MAGPLRPWPRARAGAGVALAVAAPLCLMLALEPQVRYYVAAHGASGGRDPEEAAREGLPPLLAAALAAGSGLVGFLRSASGDLLGAAATGELVAAALSVGVLCKAEGARMGMRHPGLYAVLGSVPGSVPLAWRAAAFFAAVLLAGGRPPPPPPRPREPDALLPGGGVRVPPSGFPFVSTCLWLSLTAAACAALAFGALPPGLPPWAAPAAWLAAPLPYAFSRLVLGGPGARPVGRHGRSAVVLLYGMAAAAGSAAVVAGRTMVAVALLRGHEATLGFRPPQTALGHLLGGRDALASVARDYACLCAAAAVFVAADAHRSAASRVFWSVAVAGLCPVALPVYLLTRDALLLDQGLPEGEEEEEEDDDDDEEEEEMAVRGARRRRHA